MKTLSITVLTALALFGQPALQPGGLATRSRGFVKPLKFALYFRSVQPAAISVEEHFQVPGTIYLSLRPVFEGPSVNLEDVASRQPLAQGRGQSIALDAGGGPREVVLRVTGGKL